VFLMRPVRWWMRTRRQRVVEVEVRGTERVKRLLADGAGVLIMANHPTHADALLAYDLAERLRRCFHVMTAAEVFANASRITRWILQRHGCFSVDRAGADLRAFKRSVEILQRSPNPLMIFPEGQVYHLNDHVTPFRDGPTTIALSAVRRAERPIYCVPCALKYWYVRDPTAELEELMTELERRARWLPQPDRPLAQRILKYAAGQLALKEVEYLGSPQAGALPDRLSRLREHILGPLEKHYETNPAGQTIPERIKAVSRGCVQRLQEEEISDEARGEIETQLHHIFVVVQLYSYLGDYLEGTPPVERLAETLDKFEEDVIDVTYATVRGTRRAVVALGEPVDVSGFKKGSARKAAPELTREIENRVQALLDELASSRTR
jgi:hypothetical protein